MAFEFKLPDIGEGVVEGEIVRWLVKEGDRIAEDQPMVEVMTDKATVEIPSPKAGIVTKILVGEGKICKVGQSMLSIDETGSNGKSAHPPVAAARSHAPVAAAAGGTSAMHVQVAQAPARAAAPPPSAHAGKVLATPATRKLARDLGVDLSIVRGTGPGGRVTAEDVRGHLGGGTTAIPTTPAPNASLPNGELHHGARTLIDVPAVIGDRRVPLRGLRKKIAENMALATRTAAHFTYVEEADVTDLVAVRERAFARATERGVKLTFLPFIVKAVVAGLKKFPMVNSVLDETKQEIVYRGNYHIGVATATKDGLIVPVVRDADKRSIFDIAIEIERLSRATREGKAKRDELTGSTFTISSLGALGGVMATPIINYPEVAILGVHKFIEQPRVVDKQIVVRTVGNLSVSFDHRVVDGYEGALFLQEVVKYLADPTLMFLEMV
jgi:pyruvate dehydrogenase E2 component (dihydrolipoamide acetyltransferase)